MTAQEVRQGSAAVTVKPTVIVKVSDSGVIIGMPKTRKENILVYLPHILLRFCLSLW